MQKRTKSYLPTPPTVAPNNTPKAARLNLNFKVPAFFHRRFGLEAKLRGISQVDLLFMMMDTYFEKYGGTVEAPAANLLQTVKDEAVSLSSLVRSRRKRG